MLAIHGSSYDEVTLLKDDSALPLLTWLLHKVATVIFLKFCLPESLRIGFSHQGGENQTSMPSQILIFFSWDFNPIDTWPAES